MRKLIATLVGASVLAAIAVPAASAVTVSTKFKATLRGTSAGDPNGSGSFEGTLKGNRLCYELKVSRIAAPVAAHIHKGKAGVSGPVVVPLVPPAGGNGKVQGKCVNVGATIAKALRKNPGGYYVNVHTGEFPAGAVRGQLRIDVPGMGGDDGPGHT